MAADNLFKDLKVKFHWSEIEIMDRNGNQYVENQELEGEKAYEFLAEFISKDKELWNLKLYTGGGYWKSKISISYKDLNTDAFRVDLSDIEFGLFNNVAESLRCRLGIMLLGDTDDVVEEFNTLMDSFAKEETAYLENNPDLQERLNIEPVTYLYCVDPKKWETIPSFIQKFYKETELSVEDRLHFFTQPSSTELKFLRGARRPDYLMGNYNETALLPLVPKREQEILDDFEENFSVSFVRTFPDLEDRYEATESGFSALSYLCKRIHDDFKDFEVFKNANYYVPEEHFDLSVKYQDKELTKVSYDLGSGDCMRTVVPAFSDLCKNDPEFKEKLITVCKYKAQYCFGMDTLFQGLDPYEKECLATPLPDKETSLATFKAEDYIIPDQNTSRFDDADYFNHIQKIAMLNSSSRPEIFLNMAKNLADDGFSLSTLKPILRHTRFNLNDQKLLLDAFRNDKEVKKIVKMYKTLHTVR